MGGQHGLVQRYGGIDKCKEIIENAPPDAECYSWLLGDSGVRDKTVYLDDLAPQLLSMNVNRELGRYFQHG